MDWLGQVLGRSRIGQERNWVGQGLGRSRTG
jgi:hypothetical protein